MEFPSYEQANACYDDPAYQEARQFALQAPSGNCSSLRESWDHEALQNPDQAAAFPPEPAVPIKRSIRPDYVICLEDGIKLKMLKRHLRTSYNMSPDEYRRKWGLSSDYPMVAPKYAARRSEIAKIIGLGRKPGQKVKGKKVRK